MYYCFVLYYIRSSLIHFACIGVAPPNVLYKHVVVLYPSSELLAQQFYMQVSNKKTQLFGK